MLYLAANTAERLDLLQDMVSGYARGGHMTPANRVLALAADGAERLALLQDMAACYALGGHVTQANRDWGLLQMMLKGSLCYSTWQLTMLGVEM